MNIGLIETRNNTAIILFNNDRNGAQNPIWQIRRVFNNKRDDLGWFNNLDRRFYGSYFPESYCPTPYGTGWRNVRNNINRWRRIAGWNTFRLSCPHSLNISYLQTHLALTCAA